MSEKLHTYKGAELHVTYDSSRCLHAAKCVAGLPAVFDAQSQPWVKPDGASAAEVIQTVCACPTGALRVEDTAGNTLETAQETNTIHVAADGPLYIRGEIGFLDPSESVVLTECRAALCRCGHSKNKPYCDDSHIEAAFTHSASTLDGKYGEAAEQPSPINVEPLANGPLFITGSFQLISSDGTVICEGNKTALCRCGLSKNKPFCDGSHREGGFEAAAMG